MTLGRAAFVESLLQAQRLEVFEEGRVGRGSKRVLGTSSYGFWWLNIRIEREEEQLSEIHLLVVSFESKMKMSRLHDINQ